MSKIFIGGSRHVSHLGAPVRERLDRIMEKRLPVIVGDANGADKAVQQYLFSKDYSEVEVFCSGSVCRNNVGNWRLRNIRTEPGLKGRAFYTAKDRVMTDEATFGFMVWDGKSSGTLLNVLRLLRQNKKVVVYNVPEHRFAELKAANQWDGFIAPFGASLRGETEEKAALEDKTAKNQVQAALPMAFA